MPFSSVTPPASIKVAEQGRHVWVASSSKLRAAAIAAAGTIATACWRGRRRHGARNQRRDRLARVAMLASFHERLHVCLDPDGAAEQSLYLDTFKEIPQQRENMQQDVERMLENYLGKGYDPVEGYAAALRGLLGAGYLKKAVEVFERAQAGSFFSEFVKLPLDVVCSLQSVLGRYGQWKAGAMHIQACQGQENYMSPEDATACYNALLSGILAKLTSANMDLVNTMLSSLAGSAFAPDETTLKIVLRAIIDLRSPNASASLSDCLLTFKRQYHVNVGSAAMLLVSEFFMKTADMDAAYYWYALSQAEEDRQRLDESQGEFLSQFVRALAITGQVRRLLRVLRDIQNDGGVLPQSAASLSISGHTIGRTLAAVWLEPCAAHLRRRSFWTSDQRVSLNVSCAEEFNWGLHGGQRHEVCQWTPYLAPDTKLERAWLSPLRAADVGALGLERDWAGENPCACAARDRLGEGKTTAEFMKQRLRLALRLDSPGERDSGDGMCAPLQGRSWRVYHADEVKGGFPTGARATPISKDDLKRKIANDARTRCLVSGKQFVKETTEEITSSIRYSKLVDMFSKVDDKTKRLIWNVRPYAQNRRDVPLDAAFKVLELLGVDMRQAIDLKEERIRDAAILVLKLAGSGESTINMPLTAAEYHDWLMNLSDERIDFLWDQLRGPLSPLCTPDVTRAAQARISREHEEDFKIDGDPSDELHLAADVVQALRAVGIKQSSADLHALLAASHAAGDQEAAARLLAAIADQLEAVEGAEGATERAEHDEEQKTGHEVLVDAMERGGWERTSVEQFLAGQVPVPRRDPTKRLGQYLTKYMDPLMGLGKNRAGVLHHLEFGQNSKAKFDDNLAEMRVTVTAANGEEFEETAYTVFERLQTLPFEEWHFLAGLVPQTGLAKNNDILQLLGYPQIRYKEAAELLGALVQRVAEVAMRSREASLEAAHAAFERT